MSPMTLLTMCSKINIKTGMTTEINIKTGETIKYVAGVKHCEDGPAVICPDGSEEWWYNGKIHRLHDKPALIHKWGRKEWVVNGITHRENGPAIEWFGGTKEWYRRGFRHREDGPAIEVGETRWVYNGRGYDIGDLCYMYQKGTKLWCIGNLLHREDGYPAIEHSNGYLGWFHNGKRHLRGEIGSIVIAMLPLNLSQYILLWIFQWSHPEINELNQSKLIALIEGLRNSYWKIKGIE